MKLSRRDLRRLIESMIYEEEKKDQQIYITVKYIPYGESAHDAEALRDKILDTGELSGDHADQLKRSKPGHELNHDNIVGLCSLGGLKGAGHLCQTKGRYLINKGVINSDFDSKGATVVYRQVDVAAPDKISNTFDAEETKKYLIKGLKAAGLTDGVSVNVEFKG